MSRKNKLYLSLPFLGSSKGRKVTVMRNMDGVALGEDWSETGGRDKELRISNTLFLTHEEFRYIAAWLYAVEKEKKK